MRTVRSTIGMCTTLLSLALLTPTRISADVVDAPPIHDIQTGKKADLGGWNDVFALQETGQFLLRRGDELLSLSQSGPTSPKSLGIVPDCRVGKMVAGAHAGDRSWVFFESRDVMPFALETGNLERVDLVVPGVKLPGLYGVKIQSCWVVPQYEVAFIAVSSGDPETWPREHNWPVYFWMDLKSGRTVRFPIGWDLYRFSPDQTEAVFEAQQEEPGHHRPWRAVDVKTGASLAQAPGREQAYIPFNWSNTQLVRPVMVRRPPTQAIFFLGGLALNGSSYELRIQNADGRSPLEVVEEDGIVGYLHADRWFLSKAEVEDGIVGYLLHRDGAGWQEPSPLYVARLQKNLDPNLVSKSAKVFEMLRHGNCVYVTPQPKPKESSVDAFFYDRAAGGSWNVLDQVEQLPPLPPEYEGKSFIEDSTSVRLVGGVGEQDEERLVLCILSHIRRDLRNTGFPKAPPLLKWVTWRRAVILRASGQRYMTDLFREGAVPDSIWLYSSGKLVTSELDRNFADSQPGYQFHLYVVDLPLPTAHQR